MDDPEYLVGVVNRLWILDHVLDDFAVDREIKVVYFFIFLRDGIGSRKIFGNKRSQRPMKHGGGFVCHG